MAKLLTVFNCLGKKSSGWTELHWDANVKNIQVHIKKFVIIANYCQWDMINAVTTDTRKCWLKLLLNVAPSHRKNSKKAMSKSVYARGKYKTEICIRKTFPKLYQKSYINNFHEITEHLSLSIRIPRIYQTHPWVTVYLGKTSLNPTCYW